MRSAIIQTYARLDADGDGSLSLQVDAALNLCSPCMLSFLCRQLTYTTQCLLIHTICIMLLHSYAQYASRRSVW